MLPPRVTVTGPNGDVTGIELPVSVAVVFFDIFDVSIRESSGLRHYLSVPWARKRMVHLHPNENAFIQSGKNSNINIDTQLLLTPYA